MENKPGDGKHTPFGNENGDVAKKGDGKGHDFIEDNTSHSPAPAITDFSEPNDMPAADGAGYNKESVPQGGTMPFSGEPKPLESAGLPFKLNGG